MAVIRRHIAPIRKRRCTTWRPTVTETPIGETLGFGGFEPEKMTRLMLIREVHGLRMALAITLEQRKNERMLSVLSILGLAAALLIVLVIV
jgi:hypothetical protein